MIYDINLMPRNRKNSSGNSKLIVYMLLLCCITLLVTLGLCLPLKQKNLLRDKLQKQENELSSYTEMQDSYSSLQDKTTAISQTDIMFDLIKSSNIKMTTILEDIENNIPIDINVKDMSYESGLLTIEGYTPNYTEVASFMVNLRKLNNVLSVTFMSATLEENQTITNIVESNGELQYDFTIYIQYNSIDVFAQNDMTNPDTENRLEEQEGDQDEANQ